MADEIRQADVLIDEESNCSLLGIEYLRRCGAQAKLEAERLTVPVVCGRGAGQSSRRPQTLLASMESRPTVRGVGGVVTVPGAQKKGLARRLMQHTADFFEREWKVDAGVLFCLPKLTAYYEALRWREVEGPVLIEQPSGKIVSPLCVRALPLVGEGWSSGSIELGSLPW
jgi:hypothetical protein